MEENIIVLSGEGRLEFQGKSYRCAVGLGGVVDDKRAGDGATPLGCFPIRRVLYRADRTARPFSVFPTEEIVNGTAWCEDLESSNYNMMITKQAGGREEGLWRESHVFDIVVVLGHNDNPIVRGKGSGIFFHVARENYTPTEGCVAASLTDIIEVLGKCKKDTLFCVRE